MELNNINNVELFNYALGAKKSRAEVADFSFSNYGGTSFQYSDNGDYEVDALDSLNLSTLDFMKIDVEGFEQEVLSGSIDTISRTHPHVCCEIKEDVFFKKIDAFFKRIGKYRSERLDQTNFLFLAE